MTTEEAVKWVADLFEEPADNISPETPRDNIPTWDSLGVLTLMAGLDEQFDVVLTEEELRGMQKVADILDLLRKHGKAPLCDSFSSMKSSSCPQAAPSKRRSGSPPTKTISKIISRVFPWSRAFC
jgi:acyl carrier protein